MAADGARGLSHLKVDRKAALPDGTTSFYFRTREALLHAVAARVAELDLADLAYVTGGVSTALLDGGVSTLATVTMSSAAEPGLTRTKARYELLMHANRDPAMAETFRQTIAQMTEMGRLFIVALQPADAAADRALIDDQTFAVLTFINGVLFNFARGDHTVRSAEQLDRFISAIVSGVATETRSPTA
ncbi:TetR/AcrR family transcriptional regulator [Aldersonia sp. NBC_00410]|uniref:TetR/AcrR family transcriptional regulator n=1 Tax=Aldersonia sp. NBC_00410 TaxID=2975954 RepID=UPI00225AF5E7|nr:TetR/AcrR family transcriptional regulator [Aldersonia sp. NBC_00410]MCX5044892.1 TetR/AcrR family transcriptional regulator [Aldersonia sp. NBC_00410]